MRRLLFLLLPALLWGAGLQAQQTFGVSVANHAVALPGGNFCAPFHLGIEAT